MRPPPPLLAQAGPSSAAAATVSARLSGLQPALAPCLLLLMRMPLLWLARLQSDAAVQQERHTDSVLLIERTPAETSGNVLSSPLYDAAAPHIQDATAGLHAAGQLRNCSNPKSLTSNAAVCRNVSHCLQNKEVCNAFSTALASPPPLP